MYDLEEQIYSIVAAIVPNWATNKANGNAFSKNGIYLDSVLLITLILEIEQEYGIEISDEDLTSDFDSIHNIAQIVSKYL